MAYVSLLGREKYTDSSEFLTRTPPEYGKSGVLQLELRDTQPLPVAVLQEFDGKRWVSVFDKR